MTARTVTFSMPWSHFFYIVFYDAWYIHFHLLSFMLNQSQVLKVIGGMFVNMFKGLQEL